LARLCQILSIFIERDAHLPGSVLKSLGAIRWETAMQVEFAALRGELVTENSF